MLPLSLEENMKKIGKIFFVMVALALSLFALSCNKGSEKDTTAPAEVSDFNVLVEDNNAILTWTNPADSDFAGTKLSMNPALGELSKEKTLKSDVGTFTVTGLSDGQSYTFTIKTFDKSENLSAGTTKGLSVEDKAPGEVSNLSYRIEKDRTIFTWTNPTDSDFAGIKISTLSSCEEDVTLGNDVTSYTVPYPLLDGTYYFTFKTFDKSGNFSDGVLLEEAFKDRRAPAEVSDFKVEAENDHAVLTWTNPDDYDFKGTKLSMSPAAGNLATQQTLESTTSTFTVTGLTVGQTYTFTIKTFDERKNISTGTTIDGTVKDTLAPGEVSTFNVDAENGKAILTWTNPADSDFAGTKLSMSPAIGNLATEQTFGSGVTTFTVTGLTDYQSYTFTIKTFDKSGNLSEGKKIEGAVKDSVAPGEVSSFNVDAKNGKAVLTWTNPADGDFAGTKLSMSPAAGNLATEQTFGSGVTTFTVTGLTNGQTYTFTIKTFDKSENPSTGKTIEGTVKDTLAPTEVSNFAVKAENGTAVLSWKNPADSDFAGTKLSMSPSLGELATEKTLASNVSTFTVTGLVVGQSYSFTIKTFDKNENFSTGKKIEETVKDTIGPSDVSNFKVIAENQKVSLSWANPNDEDFDGVKITVTTKAGESVKVESLESDKTSLEVTGLTNAVTYIFKIQAVDKSGNPSSGISASVVPWDNTSFVKIAGSTINGKKNEKNCLGVFINGRTVTLSDFYMCKYEVTQAEYKEVMQSQTVTVNGKSYTLAAQPSYSSANSSEYALDIATLGEEQEKRPVDGLTWYDAVYFCNAKSKKEGLSPAYDISVTAVDDTNHITGASVTLIDGASGYRLPTEAEWEYAARGGNPDAAEWDYIFSGCTSEKTYSDSNFIYSDESLDAVGWYGYNNNSGTTGTSWVSNDASGKGSHQVGKKKANSLGLFDMSGNASEWCYDLYDSTVSKGSVTNPVGVDSSDYHCVRGGNWSDVATVSSVCFRGDVAKPSERFDYLGLRLVRSVPKN